MQPVRLYTADGGFVTEGEVPKFQTPPDVLKWGVRTFKFSTESPPGWDGWNYTECFAVAFVDKEGRC